MLADPLNDIASFSSWISEARRQMAEKNASGWLAVEKQWMEMKKKIWFNTPVRPSMYFIEERGERLTAPAQHVVGQITPQIWEEICQLCLIPAGRKSLRRGIAGTNREDLWEDKYFKGEDV